MNVAPKRRELLVFAGIGSVLCAITALVAASGGSDAHGAGALARVFMVALPSYPLLAISLFAVDIIIIWSLVTYGGNQGRGAHT